MRESYDEGLASHIGPESCVVVREDRREALTGVRAGWVIEPRKGCCFGMPTLSLNAEGNIECTVSARYISDPARSKTPSMYGNTSHGTREIPRLPRRMAAEAAM
jgi:hypothetical protein